LDDVSMYWVLRALAGGVLIGLAAAIALVAHGRIAGISGTVHRALDRDGGAPFRLAFLGGLVGVGGLIAIAWPAAIGAAVRDIPTLAVAGLLVGAGTTLANGCTSGHGVCGIARLSPRSLLATACFMAAGFVTVFVVRHVLGGAP
jgi:uncharacterized membrane protein YedE/YeeE